VKKFSLDGAAALDAATAQFEAKCCLN